MQDPRRDGAGRDRYGGKIDLVSRNSNGKRKRAVDKVDEAQLGRLVLTFWKTANLGNLPRMLTDSKRSVISLDSAIEKIHNFLLKQINMPDGLVKQVMSPLAEIFRSLLVYCRSIGQLGLASHVIAKDMHEKAQRELDGDDDDDESD